LKLLKDENERIKKKDFVALITLLVIPSQYGAVQATNKIMHVHFG